MNKAQPQTTTSYPSNNQQKTEPTPSDALKRHLQGTRHHAKRSLSAQVPHEVPGCVRVLPVA